ncbi:Putative platelet-activating factor acetylhydrolase, alpha/Beta hydrolase [Septoria linicola]|uniref:Putative phospholipase n=1 Tax=Septoria linicola TaxID=215465 RepID=A0A9Q9AU58_9PEZI|nr:putative platelet-activating factor acetylhydrolase, alpha/Beta hydrolase [Septoria linicola]USW53258.1 Putative platelet-activating factor acetylhydrolase, alpha/Beta hydrolase [Septoria linicola]
MAFSWFSGWNPIVSFPEYHGPYDVGTVDVEIPAADLPSPCQTPENAASTISFRIFYPCHKPSPSEVTRPVRWIPNPQRPTMCAFANFLGVKNPKVANLISWMPQQLYWINLPAHRNAKLLDPTTSSGRWPVAVFSHGLAGSRNAYSYVCGDMASNGMVVIAMDHRDGSSPIQYVRETSSTEARIVDPIKISHEPSDQVYEARDKQLRVRLWEISMAFEALMKIDAGQRLENLDINASTKRKERVEVLYMFNEMLDIHQAGKVTWAGHSYGACTTVQLVKSIFYHKDRPSDAGKPLIVPNADAAIAHQIMPESPIVLMDMWGLPFKSPDQVYLWDKPLPSYAIGGPAGANVVSVLSEAFFNWDDNLSINKHIVAAPSLSRRPSTAPRLSRAPGQLLPDWACLARDQSPGRDSGYASGNSPMRTLTRQRSKASGLSNARSAAKSETSNPLASSDTRPTSTTRTPGPHVFFVKQSQHFNQSDFGLLFPWIAKRITKAEEPERIMELNFRAFQQTLRENGIEVAGEDDKDILNKDGEIRRWLSIPVEDEALSPAGPVGSPQAIRAMTRKLSIISNKSMPSPRDGMTMGMKMGDQMNLPNLDLPEAAVQ